MKQKTELAKKLIKSNLMIVLLIFVIVIPLTVLGLNGLSSAFLELSADRAASVEKDLVAQSEKNIDKIKSIFTNALKSKGMKLIQKDSASVGQMVEDSSFVLLRTFLQKNFKDDAEMIMATFFIEEDGEIKAWQYVSDRYPQGLEIPTEYNRKKKAWVAKYKGRKVFVPDADVLRVIKLNNPTVGLEKLTIIQKDGKKVVEEVYVSVIPIFEGLLGKELAEARKEEEAIGYLKYVLSLKEMQKTVKEEKAKIDAALEKFRVGNKNAADNTKKIGKQKLIQNIIINLVMALILIGLSAFIAKKSAHKITTPVKNLTKVAEKMARGDYKQEIVIETDDEIGILANTFKEMSGAILKRDEELKDINANLEDLVAERTSQLADEMKKIQNLLNNMKQAVFSVTESGEIVSPVSKYSEEIFIGDITSKSVYENVYKDMDVKGELYASMKTAMVAVYGEGDLQWDLMEDNLPMKVDFYPPSTDDMEDDPVSKILKVSYSPLWDDDDILEKIMFVIEDITELEALERAVASQRKNIEMIGQLASNDIEDVKDFFAGTHKLIASSFEVLKELRTEETPDQEKLILLFRNLHTIKGNARVFNMSIISGVTHVVESQVVELRDGVVGMDEPDPDDADAKPKTVQDVLEEVNSGCFDIQGAVQEYMDVAEKVFKVDNETRTKLIHGLHLNTANLEYKIGQLYKKDDPSLFVKGAKDVIRYEGLTRCFEDLRMSTKSLGLDEHAACVESISEGFEKIKTMDSIEVKDAEELLLNHYFNFKNLVKADSLPEHSISIVPCSSLPLSFLSSGVSSPWSREFRII